MKDMCLCIGSHLRPERLRQFFPTNEIMSPHSMYFLLGLIPKLIPLEHFKELSSCFAIAKKKKKKKKCKKTSLPNRYQEMTDIEKYTCARIHVNTR